MNADEKLAVLIEWLEDKIEQCKSDHKLYSTDPLFKDAKEGATTAIRGRWNAYELTLDKIRGFEV